MPYPFGPALNDILVQFPSSAPNIVTGSGSATFSTNQVTYIAMDLTVTAITGGATSPGIQFFVDRLAADGVTWSNIVNFTITSAVSPNNATTLDLGPGFAAFSGGTNGTQHAVFTTQGRLRWALVGGTPPTSVTFSTSLIGR